MVIELSGMEKFYFGKGVFPNFLNDLIDRCMGNPLSEDPDTTEWCAEEAGYCWFNTTEKRCKYWDGTRIVRLGGHDSYSYIIGKEGDLTVAEPYFPDGELIEDADPYTVIQSAFNSLTYGSLFIRRETTPYILKESLLIEDKALIVESNFAELQAASGKYALTVKCANQGLYHPSIRNLRLLGNNYEGKGIHVIDSFRCQIENIYMYLIDTGFELGSDVSWTEFTSIRNVFLRGVKVGIDFTNATGSGTGSRMETMLEHVVFQLSTNDPAVGIRATDGGADLDISGGSWDNLMFAGNGDNQTYLDLDCTVHNLVVNGVFHPAVPDLTNMIGVKLGPNLYGVPILMAPRFHSGANRFTEKIKNDNNKPIVIVGRDNIWGLLTENSGKATILNGNSSIQVAHGLIGEPTTAVATGRHEETRDLIVSARDGTNITISTGDGATVTDDRIVDFYVARYP